MVAGGLLIGASRPLLLSGSGSGSGADTGFGLIAAADSVLGLGLGLAVVTAGDATLGAVPAAETGAGLALVRMAQFTAMSFGVAILGSVLSAAYRAGLAAHLAGLPAPARGAAEGGVAGAARVAPPVRRGPGLLRDRPRHVLIVSAVVVAVAAVLAAAFLPARAAAPQLAANEGIQKATVLVKGGLHPCGGRGRTAGRSGSTSTARNLIPARRSWS